jgi:hypothetical protein
MLSTNTYFVTIVASDGLSIKKKQQTIIQSPRSPHLMVKLRLADQWTHRKVMYVVMMPLMTALAVDLLIGNVADIYSVQVKSDAAFALFLTISIISIAGQFYFLGIVMKKMNEPGNEPIRLRKVVFIIQLVLISIIILIIFQIISGSFYFTSLLSITTAVSYVLTITLIAILAWRFLTWFKTSKNLALLIIWMRCRSYRSKLHI